MAGVNRTKWTNLRREPFQVFFPVGICAGVIGAILWPLYFLGIIEDYPGQHHARIMANGLFGAFNFGFLGITLPKFYDARASSGSLSLSLVIAHLMMTGAYLLGFLRAGDVIFCVLLLIFSFLVIAIYCRRRKFPPPEFIMVGFGLVCALVGAILAVLQHKMEMDPRLISFQRLASYQGFVLFPILGFSRFVLAWSSGLRTFEESPELLKPSNARSKKILFAASCSFLIIGSFVLEVSGYIGWAYLIRFTLTAFYVMVELSFCRQPKFQDKIGGAAAISIISLLFGLILTSSAPAYRVALVHLTFAGAFATLVFVLAIRVAFGRSGKTNWTKAGTRWLAFSLLFMFAGMATRISGDFWPKIMPTHYSYGSIMWIAGVVIWTWKVLPDLLRSNMDHE